MDFHTIKCVAIGDDKVGKSSMLTSHTTDNFPSEYTSTIFDSYTVTILVNDNPYVLDWFDTSGQKGYENVRKLAYPGANIVLICFSVVYPDSVKHVKSKWIPEIKANCPKVKFLLVGMKTDLRDNERIINELAKRKQHAFTKKKGHQLAKKIGAVDYVECSALTQKGLKDIFDKAILTVLDEDSPTLVGKCCGIV